MTRKGLELQILEDGSQSAYGVWKLMPNNELVHHQEVYQDLVSLEKAGRVKSVLDLSNPRKKRMFSIVVQKEAAQK